MGLMIVVEGEDINFDSVKKLLDDSGCAIHSIDEVSSGNRLVEGKRPK